MSIKYTTATLKRLEQLFEETRYRIRYEKGQFHSGYCILEDKKIAVINKFLDVEGRINALLEIIPGIQFKEQELSGDMLKFLKQTIQPLYQQGNAGRQIKIGFEEE
ncbi:MAG TPA: hypothetical protein VFL76_01450 [Edaphocola sp.]|nr:hypothetical protein [Edaphocola sp.]